MAVKIRLARAGAKKKPFYRVVVADVRSPRDGRFIEVVGRYDPRLEPSFVQLDVDKVKDWIAKGAQPTAAVAKIIDIAEGKAKPPKAEKKVSKKAKARASAEAGAASKATEAPAAEEPAPAEAPAPAAQEAPVEEAPAEAVEEAVAEEAPAEEAPAEEAPAEEEAPADAEAEA